MPRVIGIICEYNPFHNGHKYQIDQIRASEPDATIVAIMSGNIVQRGEFAMISKYDRAKIALECGINAVFEMPYPYSGSCAEIFANAGVMLSCGLGCECIYFGVEKLSVSELEDIVKKMNTEQFADVTNKFLLDKSNSFITAKEKALCELGIKVPKYSNDMLALEYIKAINSRGVSLGYKAIKRKGAFYNDNTFGKMMSASAIRGHYYSTGEMVSVPEAVKHLYGDLINEGSVVDIDSVVRFVHSYCLNSLTKEKNIFDTSKEMLSLIKKSALESSSSSDFMVRLSSKAFTTARLKRTILYSLFDVNNVDFSPKYSVLLGMDNKGQQLLNKIKKKSDIHIITKHSDGKSISPEIREELERLYRVDAFYNALLCNQKAPSQAYKNKPIIKK